ncbi:MAG: hypothetical protein NTW19_07420 [Planctomycetota bacterium]|nr:hypothetical protein [Planctomycetota bacterium]
MPPVILWSPRQILVGRRFRLPVESTSGPLTIDSGPFTLTQTAPPRGNVTRFFLVAPDHPVDGVVKLRDASGEASATIRVSAMQELREIHHVGNTLFPRRWPLGQPFRRAKTRQTLLDDAAPLPIEPHTRDLAQWVLGLPDAQAWAQYPPSELPRTYTVNETQGCPVHGSAIYAFGGFYPWNMQFQPSDFLSHCPIGKETYPSNRLLEGEHLAGDHPDDGFGHIDAQGHRFFFAAAYHWRQIGHCGSQISALVRLLAQPETPEAQRILIARRIGLLLTRRALEELYLASVPQFRFGAQHHAILSNLWGPPDPAAVEPLPSHQPLANGTSDYCVNMPSTIEGLCRGYDAAFPWLRADTQLVADLKKLCLDVGVDVDVASPDDVLQLIEEMIACFVQADIDGYVHCNHPSTSVGTLIALRTLDPVDASPAVEHLYDKSDDQLRTFVTNGFYPDGVSYEASGGYNSMHAQGTLLVHEHIEALRAQRPGTISEERFPPLAADPKFDLIALPSILTIMCDKTYACYGDDHAPGTAYGRGAPAVFTEPIAHALGWGKPALVYIPAFRRNPSLTLARALHRNGLADAVPAARALVEKHGPNLDWPSLLLEPSGIGILRAQRDPATGVDRAAAFVHFISQPFHRHDDFMHVSLVAHDRPWSFDLGYPATHETGYYWETQWVTHNRAHAIDGDDRQIVGGGGRCNAFLDHPLAAAIELEGTEGQFREWRLWAPLDRRHRRLLVLLPTVGEGVALVDLYRLRGGREHWRTFFGSQTDVEWHGATPLTPRPGTAAGPTVARKDIERGTWSEACLTLVDEIRAGDGAGDWTATAICRDDTSWRLAIHGLGISSGVEAMVGRATQPQTAPEDSPYRYSPLLLRRAVSPDQTSSFDLVFEPHKDRPAITRVERLEPVGDPDGTGAAGVRLEMVDGSSATVLWNPAWPANPVPARVSHDEPHPALSRPIVFRGEFAGDFELLGPMGIWREDAAGKLTFASAALGGSVARGGNRRKASRGPAIARVVSVDHAKREVVVEPASPHPTSVSEAFRVGASVRIFPRGHWYRVEAVEPIEGGRTRLRFDLTGVLSSARIAGEAEGEVTLAARLPLAWAGYFRKCRLQVRGKETFLPVLDVRMREDRDHTFAMLDADMPRGRLTKEDHGQWADLVDYWPRCVVVEQGMETFTG